MKRLTFLLLCITTLGFVSCKKDVIAPQTQNFTIFASIQPTQWQTAQDSEGRYYYVDINNQEIERYEVDGVIVSIARFNDDGYDALPFSFGGVRYSYTSYPGKVRIYLQNQYDQNVLPARPTAEITTRVVLVASAE
ncbi:WW domain-containing protein [Pedobacter sp. SYP-B3415]|uniref:WW domain-containing protein n=1 Tax=Pedobacter sp. SYP-B3415 TaxID=2496641 RepID=UPI00101C7D82|nr:WW domain-containing protein [Pedobacter sp. SYP-B3415]